MIKQAYRYSAEQIFSQLRTSGRGLSSSEVVRRLAEYGRNEFPAKPPPTLIQIFFRQFLNPLIYILCGAAGIAILIGDHSDAGFNGCGKGDRRSDHHRRSVRHHCGRGGGGKDRLCQHPEGCLSACGYGRGRDRNFPFPLAFNTPMPLTPVQILWLNLVTNGIQDKGLAFEPGEGDELKRPPRRPDEPIFNRRMIELVIISALVMGGVSFWMFNGWIASGMELGEARNLTLMLMVIFENVMVGNCRSEFRSAFSMNPFRNPILLVGTAIAQLIHVAALYMPGLSQVLAVAPISFNLWLQLLMVSLSVLLVVEVYKALRRV